MSLLLFPARHVFISPRSSEPQMNQVNRDRATITRKPWIGDVIAAYEKNLNTDCQRQVHQKMVLFASLIILLYFGWSFLPLAAALIWAWFSDKSLVPLVVGSVAVSWSLFCYYVFKAWWKNFYHVDDKISVSRSDVPSLFQLIDEVCVKWEDAKVDKVIFTEGHGAWAVFGRTERWYGGARERFIKLGVLTLYSLSVQDLKAVLAHEAHHLFADNQNGVALGHFAYTIAWSTRWAPLYWPVKIPLRVLERHLIALMYVRSKRSEKAADAYEVETCGPREVAISLLRFYAAEDEFRKAGPEVERGFWLQEESQINRRTRVYEHFIRNLFNERTKLTRRMKRQLGEIVAIDDIHPSLRNRIESALGPQSDQQLEELVMAASEPIDKRARVLLGYSLMRVTRTLDKQQWAKWKSHWKAFNEHHLRLRQRLVPAKEVTTVQQAKDYYNTVSAISGEYIARPWLDKAMQFSPQDTRAKYLLAHFNLEHADVRGQAAAVNSLHALANGPSIISAEASLNDLSSYYRKVGDQKQLEEIGRRQSRLEARKYKLYYEKQPTIFGKYSPVPLDGSISFEKCLKLEQLDKVVSAVYVARKHLNLCNETQYFVLALRFHPLKKLTETSRNKFIKSFTKQIGADLKVQRAEFHVVDRSTLVGLKVRWYGTRLWPVS